jgi:hypothetical protein
MGITVTGWKEQEQRFKIMSTAFQSFEIAEIINYALQQVVDLAYMKAPVFTGALRASINHVMLSDYSGEAFVGVPYAAAQEYGFVTKQGARIPGKNYFMPAAMAGQKTLIAELKKYVAANAAGKKTAPPHAQKGGGTRGGGRKYQYKEITGAGVRYHYAKTTASTKFHFRGKPGVRKSPTTKGQRPKPGGKRRG